MYCPFSLPYLQPTLGCPKNTSIIPYAASGRIFATVIKPDLILIYRKPSSDVLQLVRLGLQSELGF